MNIWIDLAHIPQYNFYKWLILKCAEEGQTVYVTVLKRGKMPNIVRKELGGTANVRISFIGKHRSRKWSAILEANIIRNFQLIVWATGKHIDMGFSNGYQLALIGWLKGFPTYSFDDDPQTVDYRPKLWFNKETCYCLYKYSDALSPKAHVLPVLKEWSYLAPEYFHPDISALDEYGVQPKEYLFLREVSVGTVNYAGQEYGAVLAIEDLVPKEFKVILSLEDKSRRTLYPDNWIVLKEPVRDIHSLIYFSSGLISSGDSMAREAALLGVPSYYLGIRYDMPANAAATEVAGLQNAATMDIKDWLMTLNKPASLLEESQLSVRKQISSRFIDINRYMYDLITTH